MVNISELLKDAPKGMKLYSPLFGEVKFVRVDKRRGYPIDVIDCKGNGKSFTKFGVYFADHPDAECLLFPSKDYRTWQGWTPCVEPNFEVGDWVVRKDGETFYGGNYAEQITLIEVDEKGKCIWLSSTSWVNDDDIRLWTIQDAKDGDVLVSGIDNPFIYNGNNDFSFVGAYVGISRNGEIMLDMFPSKAWTSIKGVKPAAKEQRDLLFQKMKEAGYQWDEKKKKLRKIIKPNFKVGDKIEATIYGINRRVTIRGVDKTNRCYLGTHAECIGFSEQDQWHLALKPHYDIANFKVGMPVLIRNYNNNQWEFTFFGRYQKDKEYPFRCADSYTHIQCIPYNDETKHLLGTTDMPSEEYINW